MKNFFRALRLIFRYKWTLVASTFTAIMVALLWGFNIGGAYPIINIITQNKPLQDWVDEDIQASRKKIAELQSRVKDLEAELAAAAPGDKPALENKLNANST